MNDPAMGSENRKPSRGDILAQRADEVAALAAKVSAKAAHVVNELVGPEAEVAPSKDGVEGDAGALGHTMGKLDVIGRRLTDIEGVLDRLVN